MPGYKVPDYKKSVAQNMFDVEVGGLVFTIPRAEWLPSEQIELLTKTGELGTITVLNRICPPVAPDVDDEGNDIPNTGKLGLGDAFRPVPIKFANEFITAWQKDSTVDPGESSASASS